jgi:hypothetical protein
MTSDQEKLANAFRLFVRTNSFIEATYGVVFFNLRQASFMDYLLRSDIVIDRFGIEIGLTGAKIFDDLFYYLYLVPSIDTKQYLINNFPKSYKCFLNREHFPLNISNGINYEKYTVDESYFSKYKEIESYNK